MKKYALYLFLFFASLNINSQIRKVDQANSDFYRYAYVDAIKTYERVYEKGYSSPDMFRKLGDANYFSGNLEKAAKWYSELFLSTKNIAPEYYYRYAQSLKAIKKYAKADEIMAKFREKSKGDSRGKKALEQKDYLAVIKENSGRFIIADAGVNTEYSDYGAAYLGDKVIFASARKSGPVYSRKSSITGEDYTNLYLAKRLPDGKLDSVAAFSGNVNSRFHESTPVFSKDGTTVYFTRNNYSDKKRKDKEGTVLLKIYRARLEGDKWANVEELPFNSDQHSVAHPALSADEKYLYFASNMPGTIGQSDIFRVAINPEGSFGKPENAGPVINTEGRETFPFITAAGELYFASDGHPGLGGLDVFVSKAETGGQYLSVMNVGEPVNSPRDDFGFALDTGNKTGFVSSNRTGGKGNDDIYSLTELREAQFPCKQELAGVVVASDSKLPLADCDVTVYDNEFNLLKSIRTDKEGRFDFGAVACDIGYYIKGEKRDYTTTESFVITGSESGRTEVSLELEKAVRQLTVGDDLAKAFGIKMIYFDLDKWDIRPDAEVDLMKILDVLEQNPMMKLSIRSHTDSRNSKMYNERLSDRRAHSTMEWLVKHGIDSLRLTAKGYGENQLLNRCADGAECSEAEHQQNRRSEFIVTQ